MFLNGKLASFSSVVSEFCVENLFSSMCKMAYCMEFFLCNVCLLLEEDQIRTVDFV